MKAESLRDSAFLPRISAAGAWQHGHMTTHADEQTLMTATIPGHTITGGEDSLLPDPSPKGHIGMVVAGSLSVGLLASALLAAAPVIPATESGVTGAILVGLALGWASLAVLSVWFTDRPQRWAAAPAMFMGLGGSLLMAFGSPLQELLAWVWPPAMLGLVAWMFARAHQQLRSRSGRVLIYPVLAMLALAALGSGYDTVREAVTAGAQPANGQLVDVGGHRLYLNCTGTGSPTVVLEPGAGLMSSDLRLIAPAVARDTRVCVYDRAGRGWSDSAKTPQDGGDIAADLHTLLQRAHETGPYVLAGHSLGGLYALTFAAHYPDDVAGLVLVDSTPPAAEPESETDTLRAARPESDDATNRLSALGAAAAHLGLGRIFGAETSGHLRSSIDEYLQAGDSAQKAAALTSFIDKPLVVLTAGTGSRPGWSASQESLASLSTNSLHRVIDGSTHASLILGAKDAAATARGIVDAVSAVRTAGPLAS